MNIVENNWEKSIRTSKKIVNKSYNKENHVNLYIRQWEGTILHLLLFESISEFSKRYIFKNVCNWRTLL